MATTDVAMANNAIARLGGAFITSFDDNTKEARLAKLYYEDTVDEVLEMHDWNFSRVRVRLPQLTTTPTFDWDYEYTLPADPYCIRVLRAVADGGLDIEYVIEGRKLLSDSDSANILYTARFRTVGEMSMGFQQAVQVRLAHKMSYDLTPKISVRNSLLQEFGFLMNEAMANDQAGGANPDEQVVEPDTDWINDRKS